MNPMTVWIVEDDTGYRRAVKEMLDSAEQIMCGHAFPSCIEFFETLPTEPHPDLVLMDLGLPGMDGVEGIRKLKELAPDVIVLVLTVFSEKEKVHQALEAGAAGYLLKSSSEVELINGVRQVFQGGTALSPAIAKMVLATFKKTPADDFHLSAREISVLELLADGLSVQEIADALGVTRRTAAFHLSNIYSKLEVQSQSGAVGKAFRSGLI